MYAHKNLYYRYIGVLQFSNIFHPTPLRKCYSSTLISHFPYNLFNMVSSSYNLNTEAQVAPRPESPHQETPTSDNETRMHTNAISSTGRRQPDSFITDKSEPTLEFTEDGNTPGENLKVPHLDNRLKFLEVDIPSQLLTLDLISECKYLLSRGVLN